MNAADKLLAGLGAINAMKEKTEMVVDQDSFVIRNERFDSILKAHLKKSVGGSDD